MSKRPPAWLWLVTGVACAVLVYSSFIAKDWVEAGSFTFCAIFCGVIAWAEAGGRLGQN